VRLSRTGDDVFFPLEDDLREGVLAGVREGDVRVGGAEDFEEFAGAAVEEEGGGAAGGVDDLDVLPREPAAPARAERLEGRLLGGEARGVVLRRGRAAPVAVGPLALGEDALAQARRARERFTQAGDFGKVYADGDDHG